MENTSEELDVTPPTTKKGRGRPPKEALTENSVNGETVAKPSKPKKSKGKISDEAKGKLAQQIQGIHLVTAKISGLPELEISAGESAALAESILNISSEYDLNLDGKTGAWIQLLGTAAFIYAPRLIAIKKRSISTVENAVE